MKWNELYEKNRSRRSREIDKVKNDCILKARPKNFINKYSKLLYTILLIISALLILSFHSNIRALLLTFVMLILILLFTMYFNTFTINCKNNKMIVRTNNQKVEIEYANLKNIYIEKRQNRIFIKKKDSFFLMILYKTPNNNIGNIALPILLLNEKDVQKFLNSFELKEVKSNNIVKAQKYQLKRLLIKVGLFVLVWSLIIITMIIK